MGFYGNITHSNKTSLTFDKVYHTRVSMDQAAETDGVFLGRYVLVEYSAAPIRAYYFNGNFYEDAHHEHQITKIDSKLLYQDLHSGQFYKWNNSTWVLQTSESEESYATRYLLDVKTYGRGYDSTAWMKRFNQETQTYHYVLVAELNTVVPTFHVLVDPPEEENRSPYFDKDSTNLNYYLHLQPNYLDKIKVNESLSDVEIKQSQPIWTYPNGAENYERGPVEFVAGDIYFNKAGFTRDTHIYDETNKDEIDYEFARSGRKYSQGIFEPYAKNAIDQRNWFIHLPSIGNAVCSLWDTLFSENRNETLSETRNDTNAEYSNDSLIGFWNRVRDVLGYNFAKRNSEPETLTFLSADQDKIYYTADENDVPQIYYFYAYSPKFIADEDNGTYYLNENNEYQPVNKEVVKEGYYRKQDQWVLTQLPLSEDTLYGLILTLHKLIGTGDNDTRDLNTLKGSINKIKDIIANIDLQLAPNRLIWTTNDGIIQTSNTQFPSAQEDTNRVLTGAGNWENRLKSVEIIEPNTSEDNWEINTGIIDTHVNNNNNIQLQAGNKWIGLDVDTQNQLIQMIHSKSTQAAHDFAEDVIINKNIDGSVESDCVFTIPILETDNAGHVIGYTTKSIYVPFGYRNLKLSAQSALETAITTNDGEQSADNTNDTFTFETGNQWIKAAISEDKITFAHALINDEATANWSFEPTATEGWEVAADGNKLTIPTFEIDNAGHIIRNNTVDFYIPHNFRNISVNTATGVDVESVQTNGVLEAENTADTWTLASQNQWLRVAADVENDTITIGHSYSAQGAHDFANDVVIADALSSQQADNKITLPVLKTDNAGHVIGYTLKTFYVPHTFKTIAASNNDTTNASTSNSNSIIASDIVDTLTIASQNKWIDISADNANDTIAIGHSYSPETNRTDTGDIENQTPQFGDTFKIPNYETDNAGHIISSSSHTIQIPQNSYTETPDKSAGVLTTINIEKNSGSFTGTRVNVGTLALTEYEYNVNNTNKITNTDTINTAFSKVDAQIAKEIQDRTNAINTESDARKAVENNLKASIEKEVTDRGNAVQKALTDAQTYTNNKIADLVGEAPDALDTVYELAAALGDSESIVENVVSMIGKNSTKIEETNNKIDAHIQNKNNPHEVTATQVGLGNVVNESKETMFTNPEFTGIPTAPTAAKGVASTQIATTEFVAEAITNFATIDVTNNLSISIADNTKAIGANATAIQNEENARSEAITQEETARDTAIAEAVQAIFDDLLANYGITLNRPEFEVIQSEDLLTLTVNITKYTEDSHSIIWYKKQLDENPILVAETVQMTAEESGDYYCVVTRTHNGHTSIAESNVYTITIPDVENPIV